MGRLGGDWLSIFIAIGLMAASACSAAHAPEAAVTIVPETSAADSVAPPDSVPGLRLSTPRPRTVTPITATPAPEHCSDPYLTPPPVTPATEPAATATPPPPGTTPEPTRLPHAVDVPPLAPVDLPPLKQAAELDRLVRDRLGADAGHYAVVIKDLGDGRGTAFDADHVFYAASLFKLEVMVEIFHQRDAGLLDFGERYVATDYYSGFDLGPHVVTPCSTVSIDDALAAMMSVSDNVAAVMLQDRAGAGHINDAMAALGLEQTRLTEDQSLPATAGDLARLVEAIARGKVVSGAASEAMTSLMATEEIDDRIPQGVPKGTVVAHKTGNWEQATHDAGIVYGKRSTYVMVLMSDLGFGSDAAKVEADIAKVAWDYFEGPTPQ
jgi:beta-lactamase class A